jgi:hypothetical protein
MIQSPARDRQAAALRCEASREACAQSTRGARLAQRQCAPLDSVVAAVLTHHTRNTSRRAIAGPRIASSEPGVGGLERRAREDRVIRISPVTSFAAGPSRPRARAARGRSPRGWITALVAALAIDASSVRAGPVLEVAPDHLEFPSVTLGDTVTASLQVFNRGDVPLTVSEIALPAGARVLAALPFDVAPDSSRKLTVEVAAIDTSTSEVALVLTSNDPRNPTVRVPWTLRVLPLAVQTVALTTETPAPLGEPIVVQSIPLDDVHVEAMSLNFRSGLSERFDSLPMIQNGRSFIGIIPGAAVREGGVEYFVTARNGDYEATDPPDPVNRPFRIDVAAPNQFQFNAVVRNPGFTWRVGERVDFLLTLARGTVFESGTLHFRRGGETRWQDVEILEMSFTGISATIPGAYVGPTGVQYWAEIQTRTARLTLPLQNPEKNPSEIRVSVENLEEPVTHPGNRYRLVSIPLEVPPATSLGAVLSDEAEFGSYEPARWRAFRYLPEFGNLEFSGASSNFFVTPGAAFWLISSEPHRVDTTPVSGLSTRLELRESIPLAPGWNAIGNPFDFPVALAQLIHSDSISHPVAFDSDRNDYLDAPPDSLRPFEGYFVENESSHPETLYIYSLPLEIRTVAPQRVEAPPITSLVLEARSARGVDLANRIGIAGGASDERDRLDAAEPPVAPGSAVRLAIAHRDGRGGARLYRRDFRPPADGHVWELEISGTAGEAVELAIRPETPLPAGQSLRLIDREQGSIAEPARGPDGAWRQTVLVFGPDRPYRLAVAVGSATYLARLDASGALPRRVTLDPVAPNPARGALRLRFGLPEAAPVRLEVFDVAGQRVATLIDRAMPAGWHSLAWPGTRDGGAAAPSGVYFHRLTVGPERRTARSMLLR